MKPADLSKELESVFVQAEQLQKATEGASTSFVRVPYVTVSLSIGYSSQYVRIETKYHYFIDFLG